MLARPRSVRIILYAIVLYLVPGCTGAGPAGPPGGGPDDPPAFTSLSPAQDDLDLVAGGSVAFEVRAESPDDSPVTVSWAVNGESRGTGMRFVLETTSPGTYTVRAIASAGGRETRHEWSVTAASAGPAPNVAPTAVLAIDPASGRAPLKVRVRLDGDDPDGSVTAYRIRVTGSAEWTIERAAPIDTTITLDAGDYEVEGRVEDDAGERTLSSGTVSVSPPRNQPPVAVLDVEPTAGMAPLNVVIDGGGTDPDGRIVRYALDVTGDGTIDIDADSPLIQTVRYSQAGQVWVRLQVTDDRGAVARDSVLVRVSAANPPPPPANQAPTASLQVSPGSGEAPLAVHGKVTGSDPDGSVASVSIDFDGDGAAELEAGSSAVEGDFTYHAEGTYTVRATVVDDKGATASATATVTVTAPAGGGDGGGDGGSGGGGNGDGGGGEPAPNAPPTGSLTADRTTGDATLAVTLTGSGADPDGSVAKLEIDPDDGRGFVEVTNGRLAVQYPFRDTVYRPRLRVTDDGGATTVLQGQAITVYRPVDPSRSSTSASGNPRFDPFQIAPAILADGLDPLHFTIVARDATGAPVSGAPIRVRSLRPEMKAPDGSSIGPVVRLSTNGPATDGTGRLTGTLTSTTSTRVEGAPTPGAFVPFALMVEVDVGHGTWRRLPDVTGLNVETIVDGDEGAGRFFVSPSSGVCVGDTVEIAVRAVRRENVPGAGEPAENRYVEVRYAVGGALLGATPAPGYESWRTGADGWIRFRFTPEAPNHQGLRAWVDGFPLNLLTVIGATDCS